MKIAITGGTGFVGRHIARAFSAEGHELVIVSRGQERTDERIFQLPRTRFVTAGLNESDVLAREIVGCETLLHCAGINREIGDDTFSRVHVEATRNVVNAAHQADVKKIVIISFLRARPNCGSGYHESKWAAEEIVRGSGLDFSVLKCGVIYGKGDHMLDHLSHAFHTFPVFAFVGLKDKPIRPTAVQDVVKIVKSAVLENKLSRKTVPVIGPEEIFLRDAVRRVARVAGRKPIMFPLPLWFHYGFAWCVERLMKVPLVSVAQVRILSEGIVSPVPSCDPMPEELAPKTVFSAEQIRKGLPLAGRFTFKDLRCCSKASALHSFRRKVIEL
jgi:nucleoside-diphosphate-sugar epimerase